MNGVDFPLSPDHCSHLHQERMDEERENCIKNYNGTFKSGNCLYYDGNETVTTTLYNVTLEVRDGCVFQMRPRISICGSVRSSVRVSVSI